MNDMNDFLLAEIRQLKERLQELESRDSIVIMAQAFRTSSQTINSATATPIDFNTTTIDTRNAVTTSPNWRFVAPVGGHYHVAARCLLGNGAANWLVGNVSFLWLYVNGAVVATLSYTLCSANTIQPKIDGDIDVLLTKGDYVEIYIYHDSVGSHVISGDAVNTYVSIAKWRGIT